MNKLSQERPDRLAAAHATVRSGLEALGHQAEPVLRAIRRKCVDCNGNNAAEADDCLVKNCPLYPFRRGDNPWRAEVSAARRESARRIAASLKKNGTIPGSGATDKAAGTSLPEPPAKAKSSPSLGASGATDEVAGRGAHP